MIVMPWVGAILLGLFLLGGLIILLAFWFAEKERQEDRR